MSSRLRGGRRTGGPSWLRVTLGIVVSALGAWAAQPVAQFDDPSGIPQRMYSGFQYAVKTKYTDPDGRVDLKYCDLKLMRTDDGDDLTLRWEEDTGQAYPWARAQGADYVTLDATETGQSTDAQGNEWEWITWKFTIKDTWPGDSASPAQIQFGVNAEDEAGAEAEPVWDPGSVPYSVTLEMPLVVPYYWQSDSEWCWAASAAMVASYYNAESSEGVQIRPWWLAAQQGKAKTDKIGYFASDAKTGLEQLDPGHAYTSEAFAVGNVRGKLIAQLNRGKPVWLGSYGHWVGIDGWAGHAVVIVGYDGAGDSDHVVINDPSSWDVFAREPYINSACRVEKTWTRFEDSLADWVGPDGRLIYLTENGRPPADRALAFDLCPILSSAGLSIQTAHAGLEVTNGDCRCLVLDWDGKDHPGIYLRDVAEELYPDADLPRRPSYSAGKQADFGAKVVRGDMIELYPFTTNFGSSMLSVHFELAVQCGGEEVYSTGSESSPIQIDAGRHLYDRLVLRVPVSDFIDDLHDENCTLTIRCLADGRERDRIEVGIRCHLGTGDQSVVALGPAGQAVASPGGAVYHNQALPPLPVPSDYEFRFPGWFASDYAGNVRVRLEARVTYLTGDYDYPVSASQLAWSTEETCASFGNSHDVVSFGDFSVPLHVTENVFDVTFLAALYTEDDQLLDVSNSNIRWDTENSNVWFVTAASDYLRIRSGEIEQGDFGVYHDRYLAALSLVNEWIDGTDFGDNLATAFGGASEDLVAAMATKATAQSCAALVMANAALTVGKALTLTELVVSSAEAIGQVAIGLMSYQVLDQLEKKDVTYPEIVGLEVNGVDLDLGNPEVVADVSQSLHFRIMCADNSAVQKVVLTRAGETPELMPCAGDGEDQYCIDYVPRVAGLETLLAWIPTGRAASNANVEFPSFERGPWTGYAGPE